MKRGEVIRHTFIVKLWIEETAEEAGRATWRGHVTHVNHETGATPVYVQRLGDIGAVLVPYLVRMGVRVGWWWRVRRWWYARRRQRR